MGLLIVGTVALDSVETPFGKADRVLGGSGTFASFAASFFSVPKLVGVVGEDFPESYLELLRSRAVDTAGVVKEKGKTFYWAGKYETDVNVRTTLTTELNVLQTFNPVIPEKFRDSSYLFLANIDPKLQLKVLDQCSGLKFTVMDTMNYWIENTREALDRVLGRVDAVLLNDEEARMLTGTPVLQKAADSILKSFPSMKIVIIKKGEHGAMMFSREGFFALPGYPLDVVKDPTGAGDSFAGGFIGWISRADSTDEVTLRQAVAAGSATASFCCEDFSVDRFRTLDSSELKRRAASIRNCTEFASLDW